MSKNRSVKQTAIQCRHCCGVSEIPCRWIVLSPYSNVLVEVMRSEDRRVTCQVVKVVHDDGHEQIQHLQQASRDSSAIDADGVRKFNKLQQTGFKWVTTLQSLLAK